MSVSEERLRNWIEKADHDLGTAIAIAKEFREFLQNQVGFDIS